MKPVVLQLIDSFHQGGSERQALQLTRLLHESGRFRVHLACLNPEGILRNEIADLNLGEIPAYPLHSFKNLSTLTQLRRFARFVKQAQVAVLQTHDFYTNVFGMFGGAWAGTPVRIASRRETTGMRSGGQQTLQLVAYRLAHQVLANSAAVQQQLIHEGVPQDKISVIYNGLDLNRITAGPALSKRTALKELNLDESLLARLLVAIVANMRLEVKDYPMFLRAMKRVRDAVPGAAFLLAGEGELLPKLRQQATDLGLANDAYFLGGVSRVAQLLAISDVCVLTSKSEGFSNSILEYMAAAKPVVATDVGGAREAIVEGVSGYLVSPGDDVALAEKVSYLLRNPDKAQALGAVGRSIIAKKFSCEAQLENTETLYDRLLQGVRNEKPVGVEKVTREIV